LAVSEVKSIAKLVSDIKRIKNTLIHSVLKLPLLLDQQKVGELILSITSCPSIIILENTLN
jgi:hypothetical protein